MKKPIIKFFDKIILALLGFFGMFTTGCKPEPNCSTPYFSDQFPYLDSLVVMYGPLPIDFEIRGKVTHNANSKPIPHIRIISKVSENFEDTVYTNSDGKYEYRYIGFIPQVSDKDGTFYFKVEDIDGENNGGEFVTKEIEVKISDADQVESCGKDWPSIRYEKNQNIKLERKK